MLFQKNYKSAIPYLVKEVPEMEKIDRRKTMNFEP